jgi:hypothetical protein
MMRKASKGTNGVPLYWDFGYRSVPIRVHSTGSGGRRAQNGAPKCRN